jgi:outer membrane protein assembly factor BamD
MLPYGEAGLYWRANADFQRGRYADAREKLQALLNQFPGSVLAPEARLGVARTYFEERLYNEARSEYQKFLQVHPAHERLDEALYHIALASFRQVERVDRDQSMTRRAVQAFQQLLAEVPDSPYAPEARARLQEARRRLAEKELEVGLFYFRREEYAAASGRFAMVLREYAGLGLEGEALYYLGEVARARGEQSEAAAAYYRVIAEFPDSPFAVAAGKRLGVQVEARPASPPEAKSSRNPSLLDLLKDSWTDFRESVRVGAPF